MAESTYLPQRRIALIVEDCKETRAVVTAMIESVLDLDVVEAGDGAHAVELALHHKPVLIIMDLDLPVLDGFQATQQIREQPENRTVPIIALSAHGWQEEWREKALRSGCDYVLESRGDFSWVEELARPLLARTDESA
jgi:CheY-like chemotaxis protein